MGLLGALPGPLHILEEERRREGLLEGLPDPAPRVRDLEGLEAREGGEGSGEAVAGLGDGVGLDVHEDCEAVEGARDGLRGCAGRVLGDNEALDGVLELSRGAVEGLEAKPQGVRVDVLVSIRAWEPVG